MKTSTLIIIVVVALVVLILPVLLFMIGSLAYFGALDQTDLLPERCVAGATFSCVDKATYESTSMVQLENSARTPVTVTNVSGTNCGASIEGLPRTMESGEKFRISLDCGGLVEDTLELIYTQTGGIQRSAPVLVYLKPN
ncbi:MAG: hypothetical protein ACI8Y7_000024 [Candidatus Woesearchaeota archaeon]|jgi:hypothetical protein